MSGAVGPVTEKPLPEIEPDVMLTGAVPMEFTVNDFVTAVPTATLPKSSEVPLKLKAAVPVPTGESVMANVFATPPAVAVMVAVCVVDTPRTVVVKEALDAPAGTVTPLGTMTAPSLVFNVTENLFVVFELRYTEHASAPFPV